MPGKKTKQNCRALGTDWVSDPWLATCFCWVGKAAPTPVWLATFCTCCQVQSALPLMWQDLSRARGRNSFVVFLRNFCPEMIRLGVILHWLNRNLLGFLQSKPGNVWLNCGDKPDLKTTQTETPLFYDTAHMGHILLGTVLKDAELGSLRADCWENTLVPKKYSMEIRVASFPAGRST